MYRLKSGKLWRWADGEQTCIRAGEVFEPSEAELLAFGDLMEPVIEEPAAPAVEEVPVVEEPAAPKKTKRTK